MAVDNPIEIRALYPASGWRVFRYSLEANYELFEEELPVIGWIVEASHGQSDDLKLYVFDLSDETPTAVDIVGFYDQVVNIFPPGTGPAVMEYDGNKKRMEMQILQLKISSKNSNENLLELLERKQNIMKELTEQQKL